MPRTLPWLTGATTDPTPRSGRTKSTITPKEETPSKCGPSSSKRDFFRSSPSPPSSPIHQCPSEEFLIEGFDKDDMYMMVEDEFYTVAQTYTQHLHYAEYVRRKKEAKVQNAAVLRDLARPTDGVTPLSNETRIKHAADALSAQQKAGLDRAQGKRPHGDSDREDEVDDAESWMGTSLYDLMLSPRKVRSLVGMQSIKSSTRAAAGYSQSLSRVQREMVDDSEGEIESPGEDDLLGETASEGDDDLDAPTGSNSKPRSTKVPQRKDRRLELKPSNSSPIPLVTRSTEDGTRGPQTINSRCKAPIDKSIRKISFDDFDELPELRKSRVQLQDRKSSSVTKTQQNGLNGNNSTGAKKSRLNEVPTFLF